MIKIEGEAGQELLSLMRALTGQVTATAAAQELGVSRKTFYQRARRLLEGAQAALFRKAPGRPRNARDTEKETLLERLKQLERDKLELQRRLRVRDVLQQTRVENGKGTKKKAGAAGRGVGGRRDRAL